MCESNCCAQGSRFMAPAVVCPAAVTQRAPLAGTALPAISTCSCWVPDCSSALGHPSEQVPSCLQAASSRAPSPPLPFRQPGANQTPGKGTVSVLFFLSPQVLRFLSTNYRLAEFQFLKCFPPCTLLIPPYRVMGCSMLLSCIRTSL